MIFDAHSDFGVHVYREYLRGNTSSIVNQHYPDLIKGKVKSEIMTVGGDFSLGGIDFRDSHVVLEIIRIIKNQIAASNGLFTLILSSDDINQVENSDSIGIILGLEGASPIKEATINLQGYFEEGVRSLILTGNDSNEYASGCSTPEIGLTSKGKMLIEDMNDIPMVLDLSHLSEKSCFEISGIYHKPFIFSHANVKALSNHFRNLSDKQIDLIRQSGGFIGLSLISLFIDAENKYRTTIDKFIDHIDYLRKIGICRIGIGADFMDYIADIVIPHFKEMNFPETIYTYPNTIESIKDAGNILYKMKDRNYNEDDIENFSYYNLANLLKQIL